MKPQPIDIEKVLQNREVRGNSDAQREVIKIASLDGNARDISRSEFEAAKLLLNHANEHRRLAAQAVVGTWMQELVLRDPRPTGHPEIRRAEAELALGLIDLERKASDASREWDRYNTSLAFGARRLRSRSDVLRGVEHMQPRMSDIRALKNRSASIGTRRAGRIFCEFVLKLVTHRSARDGRYGRHFHGDYLNMAWQAAEQAGSDHLLEEVSRKLLTDSTMTRSDAIAVMQFIDRVIEEAKLSDPELAASMLGVKIRAMIGSAERHQHAQMLAEATRLAEQSPNPQPGLDLLRTKAGLWKREETGSTVGITHTAKGGSADDYELLKTETAKAAASLIEKLKSFSDDQIYFVISNWGGPGFTLQTTIQDTDGWDSKFKATVSDGKIRVEADEIYKPFSKVQRTSTWVQHDTVPNLTTRETAREEMETLLKQMIRRETQAMASLIKNELDEGKIHVKKLEIEFLVPMLESPLDS